MNNSQLIAKPAGGAQQATTGSPQTASAGNFLPGQRNNVQTGTPEASLNKSTTAGVPLGGTQPTIVNVPPASAAQTTQPASREAETEPRELNPVGVVTAVVLVVFAAVLIWSALHPVKNTTD